MPDLIRISIGGSVAAMSCLDEFDRYVPTRFLRPWFVEVFRGVRAAVVDQRIRDLSQEVGASGLYRLASRLGGATAVVDRDRASCIEC